MFVGMCAARRQYLERPLEEEACPPVLPPSAASPAKKAPPISSRGRPQVFKIASDASGARSDGSKDPSVEVSTVAGQVPSVSQPTSASKEGTI